MVKVCVQPVIDRLKSKEVFKIPDDCVKLYCIFKFNTLGYLSACINFKGYLIVILGIVVFF